MLGGIGGRRKRGRQRMKWLDGITDWMDVSSIWEMVIDREAWCGCDLRGHKELDTTERLNGTELSHCPLTPEIVFANQAAFSFCSPAASFNCHIYILIKNN